MTNPEALPMLDPTATPPPSGAAVGGSVIGVVRDAPHLEAGAKAVRDAVVAKVPLKVASTAEDIAQLVCFLASPASSNMTGEFVRMDAGMHLVL